MEQAQPINEAATGDNSPILLIGGPTAVGKSEIALELAARLSGEIISADSMQVYRGMDIGTAKPSIAERERIPHHLIDVADITQPFDAARFLRMADEAIDGIRSRGKMPIICGGTGFYLKAWLAGLGNAPAANAELRAQLSALPLEDLLKELERADPITFEKIDRQNPRRVIRAVEVIRLTGKPFSAQRAEWAEKGSGAEALGVQLDAPARSKRNVLCYGISRPPGELRERINQRVDQMFARGLVRETEQLIGRGLTTNPTAMQALGYRQVVEHLNGVRPLDETVELVKIRTRQFAKRQMTWFRRQMRLEWHSVDEARDVASLIAARWIQASNGARTSSSAAN
jgi:tRNA dimethylallyltransferase